MTSLLGSSPRDFLRRHWQRRPLFVRAALPQFAGVVDARELAALAARDDVESRIVERRGKRWTTQHGPFNAIKARKNNWTLLVSGVNLHVAAADALLRRFAFIPQARLDDVMVSYATRGGGVGPHVDSYDVFLLQGPGRRRWRISLRNAKYSYVAKPGDLLYLPPGWRHDGVALEPCYTYSIGFRAPRGRELGAAFLDWLHERGLPDASYRDARLRPTSAPGRIPAQMIAFCEAALGRIDWSGQDARRFLGEYLSTPKPHVVFARARAGIPLTRARLRLDAKTQLLYSGRWFFMNGESLRASVRDARMLRELADQRTLAGRRLAGSRLATLVMQWHRSGYLHLERV
jgi:50S ribosomal protein L16 3-hydroxylase